MGPSTAQCPANSVGVPQSQCVAYGDWMSDVPLFCHLTKTVAVNSDHHLADLAAASYRGDDLPGAYALGRALGAIPEKDVTKRTNVLVIGDLDPAVLIPGAITSGKAARAFALQAKGQEIEVMTEEDFLRSL